MKVGDTVEHVTYGWVGVITKYKMKIGDPVRFMANVGILIAEKGWSPFYGQIWEVYLPSTGKTYSLGEHRLQKIN